MSLSKDREENYRNLHKLKKTNKLINCCDNEIIKIRHTGNFETVYTRALLG